MGLLLGISSMSTMFPSSIFNKCPGLSGASPHRGTPGGSKTPNRVSQMEIVFPEHVYSDRVR